MSGERKRTHEDDLEAMNEAIHHAITRLRDAAYNYGFACSRGRADTSDVLAAQDALVIAIADRVREVRAGKP